MMYLKQFPDICREMGFDVEETVWKNPDFEN